MRKTEAAILDGAEHLADAARCGFAAIALGVGLVMAAGPVRAGDDDDEDDKTFEEKIIDNIMTGIGGTNMENQRHRVPRALAAGGASQARSAAAGRRRRPK